MTILKSDVCDLHAEITQVRDSTDTAIGNCKSDFNVKIQGVSHSISDMKSSIAEKRADLDDHKNKIETDIDNVKTIVQQQISKVNQSINEIRSDTYQHNTESVINFSNCQQQISIRGDVTKVSDSVTQLCVKVLQELTAVHKRIDERCQPMLGDIIQLKQQVGTMSCSVGTLQSEGNSHQQQLETLTSDVRQLKTAMTQPTSPVQTQEKDKIRQVIDTSVHEISELKSEKESFLVNERKCNFDEDYIMSSG